MPSAIDWSQVRLEDCYWRPCPGEPDGLRLYGAGDAALADVIPDMWQIRGYGPNTIHSWRVLIYSRGRGVKQRTDFRELEDAKLYALSIIAERCGRP